MVWKVPRIAWFIIRKYLRRGESLKRKKYDKEDGDNNLDRSSGQIIMSLCEKEGITRNELARRLGISPSQISRIVNEETKTISSDILQLHLTGVVMTK